MRYLVYESGTGRVVSICESAILPAALNSPDTDTIEFLGENPELVYVDIATGVLTDKPAIVATLSGTTISGLPIPATITVEGVKYEVTDGTAELSFNLPGTYQVVCEALHYLPKTFEVTV